MYSSNIFKPSVNSVISTGTDSKMGLSLYFMGCVDLAYYHCNVQLPFFLMEDCSDTKISV